MYTPNNQEISLQRQIMAQMPRQYTAGAPLAMMLDTGTSRVRIFVTPGRCYGHGQVFHLNRLDFLKIEGGGYCWAQNQFRLQANGRLVEAGFVRLANEQAKEWIEKHKEQCND